MKQSRKKKTKKNDSAGKRAATGKLKQRARKRREATAGPRRLNTPQKIRETETMAQVLLNVPYAASLLIDPEGIILDANETTAQRFNMARCDIIGKTLWSLMPPEVTENRKMYLKRVLREKTPLRFEDERQGVWNDIIGAPIMDDEGNVSKIAVVGVDITERRRAEEALRESEARLRAVTEHAPDIIAELDRDGRIKFINRALSGLTGDGLGQEFCAWAPQTYHPVMRNALDKVFLTGDTQEYEARGRDQAGEMRWYMVCLSPVRTEGRVDKAILVARDITERKQDEETLRNYSRRLIELEEQLRKKLATELHDELGRGVTAVGLNFTIVSEHLPATARDKLWVRIEDTQKLLEDMSGNLRGLMAKLRPPVLDDFGLTAALNWFSNIFTRRTGLSVNLRIADLFPRLSTDKELSLFRIVQEALTNASKHASAGTATIALECVNGTVRLSIMDDGRGFDPTATAGLKDNSWGMTIMRERAESIGGRFYLESSPGKGTIIIVETPEIVRDR